MTRDDGDFHQIGQMIGGYLHQDMDLIAGSVPEALAVFARETDAASHAALKAEFDLFLARHHNDAQNEFRRRYGHDFTPDDLGQTVPEFFAMTRSILDDPSNWRRYDAAEETES